MKLVKITSAIVSLLVLSGCANIEHAMKTARETACTDNWGREIVASERTRENCPLGTASEFWGPAQASTVIANSQTVILPGGTYQINQLGRTTSIHQVSRTAR